MGWMPESKIGFDITLRITKNAGFLQCGKMFSMKLGVLCLVAVAVTSVMTAVAYAQSTPSAVVKDVYQSHAEVDTFSCADKSKCNSDSTDQFDTATP